MALKFAKNHKNKDIILNKNHRPIRMCVVCRAKKEQNLLFRLGVSEGRVCLYKGFGRSFYLCENCLNKDEKSFAKIFLKTHNIRLNQQELKEIIFNVKG